VRWLLDPYTAAVHAAFGDPLGFGEPWVESRYSYISIALVTSVALYRTGAKRWAGLLGGEWFLGHPPIWIAVAAAMSVWAVALGAERHLPSDIRLALALALPAAIAIGLLSHAASTVRRGARRRAPAALPAPARPHFEDFTGGLRKTRP
jgi:hypothetical protein